MNRLATARPLCGPGLRHGAIIATAVLALAGCGGTRASENDRSSAGASPTSPSGRAYSVCLRSHGVPNFPDPGRGGQLPKADAQRLGVSDATLRAAQHACRGVVPNPGAVINAGSVDQCMTVGVCPRNLVGQVLNEELDFARCMRSHGVPNWPDPSVDSRGRPVFAISISKLGFDPYSRPVWAQGNRCSHLMPGLPGLPAAVSP
jgi:hypothetical protein